MPASSERSLQDFAHGATFAEPSVVAAYKYRPEYPRETFDVLLDLMPASVPRRVLDLGCGPGLIAIPLAERLEHVDAVDISAGMIDAGRRAPGGDRGNLRWILGPAETAPIDPPYGLATAGDSIGWMDWAIVLPRLVDALAPRAMFAILGCRTNPAPWESELRALIPRYSTNQNFKPLDVPEELRARGVFDLKGRCTTAPVAMTQSIDDYIESFHGRAGFARERMSRRDAAAFDAGVRALVRTTGCDQVHLERVADIAWGYPQRSTTVRSSL